MVFWMHRATSAAGRLSPSAALAVGLRYIFASYNLSYWPRFSDDLHFMTSASIQAKRNVT